MAPTACSARAPAPRTVATTKEANELRKTLKPLLEKKRRARINASLDRLKALILPLSGKDNGRNSKLEKADILEMTVRFLTDIQTTPSNDGSVSFKEGYTTCLQRASARLPQTSLDVQTRGRIREFIHSSLAPETPACQTCCAHSSRIMAQIQQALLTVKPSSSRVENTAILSQNQPLTTDAKVWRPW